jgi:DNA-binding MarR family transcriptional regulator
MQRGIRSWATPGAGRNIALTILDVCDLQLPGRGLDVTRRRDIDALLTACRLLVGISARSLAAVEDRVDLVQVRILTVIASRHSVTVSELAAAVGLHLSRASRACDRLAEQDWIERADDPDDGRSVLLVLTDAGRAIVAEVAQARRAALQPALRRLGAEHRAALTTALERFTAEAGEPKDLELWAMGWAT